MGLASQIVKKIHNGTFLKKNLSGLSEKLRGGKKKSKA